jgi:hypothetical protein
LTARKYNLISFYSARLMMATRRFRPVRGSSALEARHTGGDYDFAA